MGFLALYICIAVGVICIVILISALYPKIGRFIYKVGKDAKDIVDKEYDLNKEEKEEEETKNE